MGNKLSKSRPTASYSLCHTMIGHTKSINALRFSPDGQYLASVACDAKVRIWSTQTGIGVQTISCPENGSVTDVLWANNSRNDLALLFSCADGSVHIHVRALNTANAQFRRIGRLLAHTGHVENMDFDHYHRRLATVGRGEVRVWDVSTDWTMTFCAGGESPGFIARSVHFFNEGQSIMVAYLESHRIFAWNVKPWSFLWERPVFSRIGNSALSPSGKHLLIHNLHDGTDVYTVPHMNRIASLQVPVTIMTPKQVVFGLSGSLVIQGSDNGVLHIFDFNSFEIIQTLVHSIERRALVQAVTSHSYQDQHWIASGSSTTNPTVKIWKRTQRTSNELPKMFQALFAVLFLSIGAYAAISPNPWADTAHFVKKMSNVPLARHLWKDAGPLENSAIGSPATEAATSSSHHAPSVPPVLVQPTTIELTSKYMPVRDREGFSSTLIVTATTTCATHID